MTAPSRGAVAPKVVKAKDGAPAKVAVTGSAVLAYSWLQPNRKTRSTVSILPPSSPPSTVRSELVVAAATLRLSESAPVSLNPACVTVEACSRANGVRYEDGTESPNL